MKRTPIHEFHIDKKAEMFDNRGWHMPRFYEGIEQEHMAVRESCGIFDFYTMGEVDVIGENALRLLQWITVNDVGKLSSGRGALYTTICNPAGGIIDDVIVYRLDTSHFRIVTFPTNTDKVYQWAIRQLKNLSLENVNIIDMSPAISVIAVQGPLSKDIISELTSDHQELQYFEFAKGNIKEIPVYISRTGYTGELGYEFFVTSEWSLEAWYRLINAGGNEISPCGLASMLSLRLEKGYPLYGLDINEDINPIEAGLGWTVRYSKGDFIGQDALEKIRETGPSKRLVCFEVLGDITPKTGMSVKTTSDEVGRVTSGAYGHYIKKQIGLAYIQSSALQEDLFISTDDQEFKISINLRPFYDPEGVKVKT